MHGAIEVYVIWSVVDNTLIGTTADLESATNLVNIELSIAKEQGRELTKNDFHIFDSLVEF